MQKLFLSEKKTFFLFLSPGNLLLTPSLVEDWLNTRDVTVVAHFLDMSTCVGCWCIDSSLSPLIGKLQAWQSSQGRSHACYSCTFTSYTFPFQSAFREYVWYITLETASTFQQYLPFLWKVSMSVFWTTVTVIWGLLGTAWIKYPEFSHSDKKFNKG